jgi:hypothetical protein
MIWVETLGPYAVFVTCQLAALRRLGAVFPALPARLRRSRWRWLAALAVGWLNVAPLLFFVSDPPLPTDGAPARLLLGPSIAYGFTALGVTLVLALPPALLRGARRSLARLRAGAPGAARPGPAPVPVAPDGAPAAPAGGAPLSRRRFLQAASGTAVFAASTSSAWATWVGIERLGVERLTLHHPALPEAADGLRLAQISDLHVGAYMAPERLLGYLRRVQALAPDLVVVTGDVMDDGLAQLGLAADALGSLRAPLGVWAVLGNHDYVVDPDAVAAALRARGVRVLRNEAATLGDRLPGGERLAIVGIEDPDSRGGGEDYQPLLAPAFAAVPPDADFRLLLSHRPSAFPAAAAAGATLTLAGHTHGGQAILPLPYGRGLNVARLMTPFDHGLFRRGDAWLYVNRGLGVSHLPVRFNCPREITLLTLRRAPETVASVPAVVS